MESEPQLEFDDETSPGFFQGYLMLFADLFYHSFRDINDYLAKYAKFRKIWLLVSTGDLNFDLGKNDPNSFERTLDELSNVFSFFAT